MSAPLPTPTLHRSQLRLDDGRILVGHVVDPEDLACRHVVEVLADGLPIGLMRADLYDDDLARARLGDACYGFCFELQDAVLASTGTIEVRLANTRRRVGQPIDLSAEPVSHPAALGSGRVRWGGGGCLDGRLGVGSRDPTRVKALVDGQVVADTIARDWTHVALGTGFGTARAFRLHLPDDLADGRVRQIDVVAEDGTPMAGSPCFYVGFKDGLARFIEGRAELESDKIRAETFDALFPASVPFGAVERWLAQVRPPAPPAASHRPGRIGVVLVGPGDFEASLTSLAGRPGPGWTAASLSSATDLGFSPEDALDFLSRDGADCDILVFAPAGLRFEPDALAHVAAALDAAPLARSVYGDRMVERDGQVRPELLSAFDYERCLEQGFCATLFAMRRATVLDGLAAGAACLYRLFNAQLDTAAGRAATPLHCPQILGRAPAGDTAALAEQCRRATAAHLSARGILAGVSVDPARVLPAVRVARPPVDHRVSIIVPGDRRPERLIASLRRLVELAGGLGHEIVVAAEADREALRAALDAAALHAVKIAFSGHSPNPARATNHAVRAASGDMVLLLGTRLEQASPGWLEEMLGRLCEPDVGAVGPVVVWPSGVIRSAGLVLGPELSAVPRFGDRIVGEAGFGGLLEVAHECSALSAGALLTRRSLYLEVGGLDEHCVAFDLADVDLCLRLRERGYRLIVTPHAVLRGSDAARPEERPDLHARRMREAQVLRHRWGDALVSDPYYSPNLALDGRPFSGLASHPRGRAPRGPERPRSRPIPPGL